MASNTSLIKTALHNSIAEGIYNEVITRQSRYYYFLGKTLEWVDEEHPPIPTDSLKYERETRNEIITIKEIGAADVSLVIPRYDWNQNEVYDIYDDEYSDEVIGINLISGGSGYTIQPTIYVGSFGSVPWLPNTVYSYGDMVSVGNRYYTVVQQGTSGSTSPSHIVGEATNGTTKLKYVEVSNGGGTGATATPVVLEGNIIDIVLTNRGYGYISSPSITIVGNGSDANASAIVNISATGKQKLENCRFYVMTDEYNVYQCLDNNNNSQSTFRPVSTSVDPIRYPDGYIWKFMYTIPSALRNKFITESYIPVTNSIRSQFYSNGSIDYVRVDQRGAGYTYAFLSVQGDGHLESDPIYVTGYNIIEPGFGYTTATVVFDPPVANIAPWAENSQLSVGTNLLYDNNIYRVAIGGISATLPPIHKDGVVQNGTGALEYIGSVATADVVLDNGSIESLIMYGSLRDITIVQGGSGYTYAPEIKFISSSGSEAAAVSILQEDTVSYIEIKNRGDGYTEVPVVIVGDEWEEFTSYTIGEQIFFSDKLYTVTESGTTDSTPPTHETGSQYSGTVLFEYAGIAAKATASIKYGSGYSTKPNITIVGDGTGAEIASLWTKSSAKLVPIIDNGEIVSTRIIDDGVGYSFASISISGDGEGAILTPDISVGNLDTLQANVELLTVEGTIVNCPVVSGGYGYSTALVTIIGDGTGATATATVENGKVTKINMTSYGSGYSWATLQITGNSGSYGAKARAIIAPYGGFGKNSINSLFSRTIMFYSTISNDRNQGFEVNNDYRQSGIIKNPTQYGNTYSVTTTIGSACWAVTATSNPNIFEKDSIVYLSAENSPRFRIVANTGTDLLLQSIDGGEPIIGSQFTNDTNDRFTATSVTPPTIDKYSGDLMYIDNRSAFTPSESGIISLRTVIRF